MLVLFVAAFGRCAGASTPQPARAVKPLPPAWTVNKDWSGNDAAFVAAARELDREFAAKHDAIAAAARLGQISRQWPGDALAAFRWAYAAYAARNGRGGDRFHEDMGVVNGGFIMPPNPHSYHYDRMHFLVASSAGAYFALRPVGERLLKRDPNDDEVRFRYALVLADGGDEPIVRRAVRMLEGMRQTHPSEPKYLLGVGYARMALYGATHAQTDAEASKAACREFLKVAPPDQAGRESAGSVIQFVERIQAALKKAGR